MGYYSQNLTGQDQGGGIFYRGFLAKKSGLVVQRHKGSEWGHLDISRKVSRMEIEAERESHQELPEGK